MHQEKKFRPMAGWIPLFLCLMSKLFAVGLFFWTVSLADSRPTGITTLCLLLAAVCMLGGFIGLFGLIAVAPNQGRVLLLFGNYKGSVVESGFYWVNPFYTKSKISLRIRNFETGATTTPETKDAAGKVLTEKRRSHGRPSKVNDRDGNPVEISAVVVWKVVNTAEALFEVDDYEDYVGVQSEAALRSLASRYPYDSEDHEVSLRGSTQEISDQLGKDIQERLDRAGIEIVESRISHLAYAQEIAAAMLQRQQAQAVVAARTKIVEGAVGMVQMALEHLAKDNIVELDNERRAAMVQNLLVVLCSDRHTQPVINTGAS
ncbi:SPFH domain-containing protein [Aureliella helgolandensis]|uniref:SPFH domain / Band 7 family protein n=1 Tax=Aureliella helgolandensis TaxID=2527968 RepID=A0A518GAN9_9BACT|nr:SPFH domain-containing protein [Aureliella helgolandensis]QDV25668.1 SPFH domain / Band 7 family protein [Aureliella helgolandensis]